MRASFFFGLAAITALIACSSDGTTVNPLLDSGGQDTSPLQDASDTDTSSAQDTGLADANVPDSSDASPPWAPAALSGLVVWLDGTKDIVVNNGVVQTWKDQSGNGNDAFNMLPANRPTTVASAANGKPVIRFDGGGKQWLNIADVATLRFATGDFTIMEVMAYTNIASFDGNTGYAALWVKSSPQGPYNGAALFGNDPVIPNSSIRAQLNAGFNADSTAVGYNDGKFHIVGMRRTGTTLEARTDGASATKANAVTDVSAVMSDVWIGGRGGNAYQQALKGDIAEIIVVKGTVSDPNMASLEGYLKTKYAL